MCTIFNTQMLFKSVDVVESAPRRAGKQQHRTNARISDYYKDNLTIPILDHLSNERFDANS